MSEHTPQPPKQHIIGNPKQNEAIRHGKGPCLVLAGPGSGKTFVLIEHCRYLIRNLHVCPSEILVLTFSRTAAIEMKSRYERKYGNDTVSPVTFGTFHAVFYRILQQSAAGKELRLLDEKTKEGLLRNLITSCHYDRLEDPTAKMSALYSEILYHKRYPNAHWKYFTDEANFPRLFQAYETFLADEGYIDFDDMIRLCNELLKKDEIVLRSWKSRFRYFLLDEFQDIDPVQLETIELLAGEERNIFAVGDDDQSIYSFRGANPLVMQTFLDHNPGLHLVELTINYRCSEEILKQAVRLIRDNEERLEKHQVAEHKGGVPMRLEGYADEAEQFAEIMKRIRESVQKGERSSSDFAVIFRTHYQLESFRRYLVKHGMESRGDTVFREPAVGEALSVIVSYYRAALQLKQGYLSRDDFLRILNIPQRYLLRHTFSKESMNPREYLLTIQQGRQRDAHLDLFDDLHLLCDLDPVSSLSYLLTDMELETALSSGRKNETKEALDDLFAHLNSLAASASSIPNLLSLLEKERTLPVQGSRRKSSGTADGGIHLLTMHAAKGLEFPVVFLPCLNEGVIPVRNAKTKEGIEEERRLLYVAMTRAREELILTYARGYPGQDRRPSRFLRAFHVYASWE